jgi:hypothetical protein
MTIEGRKNYSCLEKNQHFFNILFLLLFFLCEPKKSEAKYLRLFKRLSFHREDRMHARFLCLEKNVFVWIQISQEFKKVFKYYLDTSNTV